jgi:hypothetical protein
VRIVKKAERQRDTREGRYELKSLLRSPHCPISGTIGFSFDDVTY